MCLHCGTFCRKQLVSSADVSDDDIEEKEDKVPKPVSIFKLVSSAYMLALFDSKITLVYSLFPIVPVCYSARLVPDIRVSADGCSSWSCYSLSDNRVW